MGRRQRDNHKAWRQARARRRRNLSAFDAFIIDYWSRLFTPNPKKSDYVLAAPRQS